MKGVVAYENKRLLSAPYLNITLNIHFKLAENIKHINFGTFTFDIFMTNVLPTPMGRYEGMYVCMFAPSDRNFVVYLQRNVTLNQINGHSSSLSHPATYFLPLPRSI